MKKALLIIDAQKIYSNPESEYFVEGVNQVLDNMNAIIDEFDRNSDMIIYVRHEHVADGSDSGRMFDYDGSIGEIEFQKNTEYAQFIDNLRLVDNGYNIIKKRYSAFIGTELNELLHNNGIEKLVIIGFMTNFCCESTARDAHDLDYFVDFIIDATGTPGTDKLDVPEVKLATVATLEAGFAVIKNTEDIVR